MALVALSTAPRANLRLIHYVDPAAGSAGTDDWGTVLRRLAIEWVAWRLRTGQINKLTAKEQRYVVLGFATAMGNRSPRQIGASDLARWRESMEGHIAPSTMRVRWQTAKAFLEWLVDEGKIKRNPARRIPSPKCPRAVHRSMIWERARRMHDACIDARERLIVALGFQLGMRRVEMHRVQIGDIDFLGRSVLITGKGGHQRVVPLTVEAEKAIVEYMAEHKISAGPLVRDRTGTRGISAEYIGQIWTRIAYRAGVKERAWDGVGSHSARHTAGTDVAHNCGDAVIVRDFLGHVSLSTTSRYVGEVDIEVQREAIEGRRYAS